MTVYYLIRDNQVVTIIDTDAGDVIALPQFGGGDAISLINQEHATNLMTNLSLTKQQALDALGLGDITEGQIRTLFIARNPQSGYGAVAPYKLIDIGEYAVWQCNGQAEDLLSVHDFLWDLPPTETLGLLAVVNSFGSTFYDSAVRTATGMTVAQALERRNRMVTFLNSQGYADTATLAGATTEHAMVVGLVEALGYTMAQLWSVMVED